MRRALPLACLSLAFSLSSFQSFAQSDRFAYAITDLTKDGMGWNALRKLDLQTGQYSDVLLNGTDVRKTAYDAVSKKELAPQTDPKWGNLFQSPFSTGVAAAAYDRKHNRLYYTPMFVDQLRYIDLKSMKVYFVTGQSFSGAGDMHNDEAKIITRMVIAADGYGYAISNDGSSFVRFSTGKKPTVERLGELVDDPANKGISIHNRCSSFGGDMIADDDGNLYILTARNHVFKVNTEIKVATHLGAIQNLPANFTVNGAVVDGNGDLLVSSAVDASAYYEVNPKDWQASPYKGLSAVFRSSDLANSNVLATARTKEITTVVAPTDRFAKLVAVYPNPVTSSRISVQFNKVPKGEYTLQFTDMLGRSVMQRRVSITSQNQLQEILLNESHAKGLYMVKVLDAGKQSVFTQKVMVQ
ncbi:T9SS type A sorting domain-containing protein [Flavisolibacter nicotianae]|uniref:T9SS type A sorting domain-containing protein n=1 Tax=Flavisolibacter nicotianae TaxID=2364882 RepID=UPI000EAC0260|nr:T9SS type A sorting domain-containing protein [Flavisolibacter nicotianae]